MSNFIVVIQTSGEPCIDRKSIDPEKYNYNQLQEDVAARLPKSSGGLISMFHIYQKIETQIRNDVDVREMIQLHSAQKEVQVRGHIKVVTPLKVIEPVIIDDNDHGDCEDRSQTAMNLDDDVDEGVSRLENREDIAFGKAKINGSRETNSSVLGPKAMASAEEPNIGAQLVDNPESQKNENTCGEREMENTIAVENDCEKENINGEHVAESDLNTSRDAKVDYQEADGSGKSSEGPAANEDEGFASEGPAANEDEVSEEEGTEEGAAVDEIEADKTRGSSINKMVMEGNPEKLDLEARFVKKKATAVKKEKKRETLPEKMARKRRRLKKIRLSYVKKPKKAMRRAY